MRNFRDSFYDKSDVFIAFIIIAVAAVVIGLRINAIMDYPETIANTGETAKTQAEEPADSTSADGETVSDNSDTGKDTSADSSKSDEKKSGSSSDASDKKDSSKDSDEDSSESKEDSDRSSSGYVTVKITDLDSSADITSMLQNKGLISSASEFEQILKNNKLTTKLKSGTFKIRKGASIRVIIKKLTGESI